MDCRMFLGPSDWTNYICLCCTSQRLAIGDCGKLSWLTAPILVVFLFAYPETSGDNILRRRAQRLRKLTGKTNIKSKREIEQEKLTATEIAVDALIKPTEIMLKDPAVLFANVYVRIYRLTSLR